MTMPDFDVPSVCPQCLAQHDGMANLTGDEAPEDGGVNLCIVCHGISVYDSSVPTRLRFPTDDELREIMDDPEIRRIRAAMKILKASQGPLKGNYYPD